MIPEDMWNDNYLYEWAIKGVRKLNIIPMLVDKVCLVSLTNHQATLPSDFQSVSQIAFKVSEASDADLTAYLQEIMGLTSDDPSVAHMSEPTGLIDKVSQYITGDLN
jgi:hypothetical protein